jgi:hypothetical protein
VEGFRVPFAAALAAWAFAWALAPGRARAERAELLNFTHPAPATVAGYRVHIGVEPGVYLWSADAGPRPGLAAIPLTLWDRARVYVALTAYDSVGRESGYSNEILLVASGVRGPDDGVGDDGDRSGIVGDGPCALGRTSGCDDNCPLAPNGPLSGTCIGGAANRIGRVCRNAADCGAGGSCSLAQEDSDADGVGDACDVCRVDADADQLDSDGDGFGNACDPDFDGDGLVTRADRTLLAWGWQMSPPPPQMDLDGDGLLSYPDWQVLMSFEGGPPGPTALACAGSPPCTSGVCTLSTGDRDGDAIGDECDNCPDVPNGQQRDWNGDGVGDACDG